MYIVEVNFIVWRTLEYVEKTTTSYKPDKLNHIIEGVIH
jgi:hypothetical protein